ncbi:MAG: glutamyl-tRNA reductase, partial [Acidobacteria bacterium]|nr:glutamyl-tRNA reductase [Acidobacteriota bacterium]
VLHLFRVASSLDSMVVGEAQILGQVKEAFSRACELGTAGPVLRELFPRAFRTAKKVRTETLIAATPLSISTLAAELAKKIFEKLDGKSILLVGTGKMAQLASREMRNNGVAKIWVTSRRPERAVQMAVAVGGTPLPYQNLAEALAVSDIVVVSTSAPHFVIDQADMARVVRQRKNQPIFVIDISVPRNVDPGVNQVDNVFLYDIDDLRGIAENNRAGRSREAVAAERIIQQEVDLFLRELNVRQNSTAIIGMREAIRQICLQEVARAMQKLPALPPTSQQALESMAERISRKISHPFLDHLRHNPKETGKLLSEIFSRGSDED